MSYGKAESVQIAIMKQLRGFNTSGFHFQEEKAESKEEAKEELTDNEKLFEKVEKKKDPKDEKIEELEKIVQELKNNWKMALADAENIKKISARDVDKAREFGIEKLVKQLMSVTDTLEYTLQHRPNFELEANKDNDLAKNAFVALDAINKQFFTIFTNYGMMKVKPAVGDNFDPMLHNAMFEVEAPAGSNATPGTVGLVVKPGWKRKDSLMRPASVGVVKSQ